MVLTNGTLLPLCQKVRAHERPHILFQTGLQSGHAKVSAASPGKLGAGSLICAQRCQARTTALANAREVRGSSRIRGIRIRSWT